MGVRNGFCKLGRVVTAQRFDLSACPPSEMLLAAGAMSHPGCRWSADKCIEPAHLHVQWHSKTTRYL